MPNFCCFWPRSHLGKSFEAEVLRTCTFAHPETVELNKKSLAKCNSPDCVSTLPRMGLPRVQSEFLFVRLDQASQESSYQQVKKSQFMLNYG